MKNVVTGKIAEAASEVEENTSISYLFVIPSESEGPRFWPTL
jgi:hypothetical protein